MKSMIPTLGVKDIATSMRFYQDVLGFAPGMSLPGDDGKLIHGSVQRGDSYLMFGQLREGDAHDQGKLGQGVVLYATVGDDEDVDALFAHAKGAGAHVVQEPVDQFWGHRDWGVTDPDGYLIYVSKETRTVSEQDMREAALAGAPAD